MIYAVFHAEGNLVKIGFSDDPGIRVAGLLSSTPVPLVALGVCQGDRQTEARLHARFKQHRAHGEWFRRTPEMESFIADLTPLETPAPRPRFHVPRIVDGIVAGEFMTIDDFLTTSEKERAGEIKKMRVDLYRERRRILDRARKRYLYWLSKNPQPMKD